jgi:DNA recombination protein RmuC
MSPNLDLALILATLTFLAACLAAWAAFRPRKPPGSEQLLSQLIEEISRSRRETQGDLNVQLGPLRQGLADLGRALATSQADQQRSLAEGLAGRFRELAKDLQEALSKGREEQRRSLLDVQEAVRKQLEVLQRGNDAKLEQMRQTVDEKLHDTLERRLGESFKQVSDRLEAVHKGLGEMQSLAQDVGGLKKVMGNFKTLGMLGEAQLAGLLAQFLAPRQFEAQVRVNPESREAVDFAVRMPGPSEDHPVWLPIDAKFPLEDYQRLLEAQEAADLPALQAAAKALEVRVFAQARSLGDKYIHSPETTDFALMFLPSEGLYAEVLRCRGLFERLQRECRVTVVGPTTLSALLNALQVGFKTLAITRQSADVWKVLGEVKTEFGKFAESLRAVDKKLQEASNKIGEVTTRSNAMARKLKDVEALSAHQEAAALPPSQENAE